MNYQRAFPVFSSVFALVYALCFVAADQSLFPHNALFAYYPALGEFHWSPLPGKLQQTGPVMLWYGWVANAAIAGLIAAGIALAFPPGGFARHWPKLVIAAPTVAFLVLCYYERLWFLR
jgi:hypothetical protein